MGWDGMGKRQTYKDQSSRRRALLKTPPAEPSAYGLSTQGEHDNLPERSDDMTHAENDTSSGGRTR